jgi:FemAB-related protein (PEP-CTERM system-associated)
MSVRTLENDRYASWDAFVEQAPDGTFLHLTRWRNVIRKAFGYKPVYIYAETNGAISGVLPLFIVPILPAGVALVSVPFGVYGGICAADDEAKTLLLEEAHNLVKQTGAKYLELRNIRSINTALPVKDLYVTFRKKVLLTEEENLNSIPRKRRAMIREGVKNGLTSTVGGNDHLEYFYVNYSHSVHNLGTPVFPKKYFAGILEEYGEACRIFSTWHQGVAVASCMTFLYKEQVLPYYAGALKSAFHLAVNDFMYWEILRYACENGYKVFDFGRSKKGTGSYHFKKLWGIEPENLEYQYILPAGRSIPNMSPANSKFSLAIEAWKRMPLPVANVLGPHIVKYFS